MKAALRRKGYATAPSEAEDDDSEEDQDEDNDLAEEAEDVETSRTNKARAAGYMNDNSSGGSRGKKAPVMREDGASEDWADAS